MRWSDVRAAMVGDDPVCSGSPSDRVALHQPGIGRGLQDLAVARAGAETTLAPVAADLDAMPAPTELLDGRGGQSPLDDDLAGARLPRRSEEHTSELQSLMRPSSSVLCLKKKINTA